MITLRNTTGTAESRSSSWSATNSSADVRAVSSVYSDAPTEYTSARRSTDLVSDRCSGAMNENVPICEPVAVNEVVSVRRAIPKSVSRHRPSSSRRKLWGFTSRWTIPAAWASASA
jgi:hypothetical protein